MKVSEVIKLLQEKQYEMGDIEIEISIDGYLCKFEDLVSVWHSDNGKEYNKLEIWCSTD